MRTIAPLVVLFATAFVPEGCAGTSSGRTVPQQMVASTHAAPAMTLGFRPACPTVVAPEQARCHALIRFGNDGPPAGYGPQDLQSAYNLPSARRGRGQVIAIVDAYDDPNAESDLGIYRSTFGLPSCTSSNGCFKKVNQTGQVGNYPNPDPGWAVEISVDTDMVSAGCPRCTILLVEANSSAVRDLGASVDEAVKLGAVVVNNSYGGTLSRRDEKYYEHPGVIMVASGGDSGYPTLPAGYPVVVSVGGTTLNRDQSHRGWSESGWGNGGCSPYPKPPWQHDSFCTSRTTNDVAAVADPSTGVAVYDSYQQSGFVVIGGTSVSTPIISSVYGLAENASRLFAAKSLYEHHSHLFDIPPKGYDEPTGWGTPDSIGAF